MDDHYELATIASANPVLIFDSAIRAASTSDPS